MPRIVVADQESEREFEYEEGLVTFGKDPQKAVVTIEAKGVADLHFEIDRTPEGFRLKSHHPLSLNGNVVSSAYLRNGDQIVIGQAKVSFWDAQQPSAPLRPSRQGKSKAGSGIRRASRPPSSHNSSSIFLVIPLLLVAFCLFYLGFQLFMAPTLRAGKLYSEGVAALERSDYDTAMKIFQQISPTDRKYGASAQEQYKLAQLKKEKVEAGLRLEELRKSLDRILIDIAKNKEDIEGNRQKLKNWLQQNPNTSLTEEVHKELEKLSSGF